MQVNTRYQQSMQSGSVAPWAYIKMPLLQLEHWQSQANLADHCLVVACEKTRKVVQSNVNADEHGIKPGMELADAWLMSDGLQHQFHNPTLETELLNQLAERLYRYFSDISIDHRQSGIWLKLKGLKRIYSTNHEVASVVAKYLIYDTSEITYQLTFASNPCLAQLGIDDHSQGFQQAVHGYPILGTFLSPYLQQKLISMGLNTLDKLIRVPAPILGKKLGKEIVRFATELRGEVHPPIAFFQPEAVFYQSRQLNTEVYTWSSLRFACKSLLQVLEQSLNDNQQSTQTLTLWLFGRDFKGNTEVLPSPQASGVDSVLVELARPAWKAEAFFSILQLKMEAVRFRQPIVDIAVQVAFTESRAVNHGSLYSNQQQVDLDLLFNRLQARLGDDRLFSLACTTSWLPEQQQRLVNVAAEASQHLHQAHDWRPPWLVQPEPTNIELWQLSRQPQRLSLPWWYQSHAPSAQRDYVLAQYIDGRWGWIFFQSASDPDEKPGGWFLHGWAS